MIDVRSVTKRFGRVVAVNEVSFHVSAGEAVALWGHNGAGKTTILRCLLGVTSFDGAIDVDGVDVGRDGRRARTRVGFVPQDVHFYHHLTVRETLALFRRIRGVGQRRDAELLAELELEEHARKPVRELSGGMRQRLALAVALLPDPPILLLDEPTSNLDESSRARFFSSLMACKEKGTTIVFSSHRTEEVSWLADRVLVLEGGSVVSESAPREAVTPPARLMRVFVDADHVDAALGALARDGFDASRNGHGVWVRIDPGEKAGPILCLARSDIRVKDFDLSPRTSEDSR